MAKIMSTLVGQGKGKIGAQVLYRANGEQFMRARAISVANPQSNAQMYQRLAISSAAKLSSQLRNVIDHSFEGVEYGTKSMQHFQSIASKAFKSAILKPTGRGNRYAPVVGKGCEYGTAVDGLQISAGSLAAPKISASYGIADDMPFGFFIMRNLLEGTSLANLTLGAFLNAAEIELTDQLTFIFAVPVTEGVGDVESATLYFDFVRINFKSEADLTAKLVVNDKLNPAIIESEKSNYVDFLEFNADDNDLRIEFAPASGEVSALALIRSAYVDGKWKRSKSYMNCASADLDSTSGYEVTSKVGYNLLGQTISTYRSGASKVEDRFLNQEDN